MYITTSITTRILHVLCCFYASSVVVNVLVVNTHRNVYFIAWATVSAFSVLFLLFRTLLVATVLLRVCHVGQIK